MRLVREEVGRNEHHDLEESTRRDIVGRRAAKLAGVTVSLRLVAGGCRVEGP